MLLSQSELKIGNIYFIFISSLNMGTFTCQMMTVYASGCISLPRWIIMWIEITNTWNWGIFAAADSDCSREKGEGKRENGLGLAVEGMNKKKAISSPSFLFLPPTFPFPSPFFSISPFAFHSLFPWLQSSTSNLSGFIFMSGPGCLASQQAG